MRTYGQLRKNKPYPTPLDEREELQNVLWGLNIAIPGSGIKDPHNPLYIEMDHLRDMVDWQVEKVANEPEFRQGDMDEEAHTAIREYLRWHERKGRGELQFSMPGIPGMGNR